MLSGVSDLDVSAQTLYKEATWPWLRCSQGFVLEAEVDPVQCVESPALAQLQERPLFFLVPREALRTRLHNRLVKMDARSISIITAKLQTILQPNAAH